jgi:hypothetical protein
MTTLDFIQAVKQKNWTNAHDVFSHLMQERVNARLTGEITTIFEHAALPAEEIQRVYDDTHDVTETELLCGVRGLKVNSQGQVVGYRSL